MLKHIENKILYPNYTITRMRYRGPIESYKQNKSTNDIFSNINILFKKMLEENNRLEQHIKETQQETDTKIKICKNNSTLFETELLNNHVLNNEVTNAINI